MNIAEVYRMKSGRLKWRLKTTKGEILAVGPKIYDDIVEATASINRAKGGFTAIHIIDRT